ncbi:Wall-associated receptor kinase 2 [Acorus gramineus]|uniref:Wall-associated receptor kinase 2 n=1 Tax=Acorus gramineus TaxID=55184 RepID=A0AAV9APA2_ACOGR|nr:Wall-associated receptor kinase 2 [Acorus gramineus]
MHIKIHTLKSTPKKKKKKLSRMLVFGVLLLLLLHPIPIASQAKPGCPNKCGDISIPYPFGCYGENTNCFREGFGINCNHTDHEGPVAYLSHRNIFRIKNISLLTGEVTITQSVAVDCYNKSGRDDDRSKSPYVNLSPRRPLTFSDSRNKFTVLGCDSSAFLTDSLLGFSTGCISVCNSSTLVTNGSCSGIGCCQTSIPKGVKHVTIELGSYNNHQTVLDFNPCSTALLVDEEWFKFNGVSDLSQDYYNSNKKAPVVLDWVISKQTCIEARRASDYACVSQNSECYDATNGVGYRCNCSAGYQGNPYLHGGCQDIDECSKDKNETLYPCKGICINTPGNYTCQCPKGKHSDNPRLYKCKNSFPVVPVALGTGIPFIVILIGSWIFLGLQTRKLNNLKDQFFEQNGGSHLQQLLSSNPNIAFKMFSKEDLERATDKFSQNNILGQGGQGMVFKGVLPDNRVVAVKKSMVVNEIQNTQFANEMIILSQINHRNVVKLLGCCVEVEVPMLVYEYISNGTLFHLIIHGEGLICLKDWLRIATETASAIAYLHSAASPPILHGDIKSSNILLDANHMAKVSDFGASKLTPLDKDQFATFMQGTWGYLDSECLQTGQLTDKSDVYSFGVVLAEFLTRKKAVTSVEGIVKEKSLANSFVTSMKENRILEVLDPQILKEGKIDLIIEICKLATRCLNMTGEERPTMKEVAMELEGLAMFEIHQWVPNNPEEMESLLGQSSCNCGGDSTGLYSLEKRAALSIEGGR